MPTVRVFLLACGRPHLFPRALASLRAQTFTDWICEVHNDAPDDAAPGVSVGAAADARLIYCPHAVNGGAVAAFNQVYRGGPEPFASMLEDDNWWDPTFLAEAVAALLAAPDAALVWANMRRWQEEADGSWTDTGRTIWPPAPAGAPPVRFEPPEILQSIDALHSNGAMVFRPDRFRARSVPAATPLAIVEPLRERAAMGPLLLLPQPLAHFAQTRQTARSSDRAQWLQCQLLIAASFFRCVPTDRTSVAKLWQAVRAQRPRATDLLFLTALALRAPRLVRPARLGEWVWFLASSARHPLRLLRGLGFRRAHRAVWDWLLHHSALLAAEGRSARASVMDKGAGVDAVNASGRSTGVGRSRARILIVTNGQLGRNPRPWKEAEALAGAGYDVTVLMVRNHAATEEAEAAALSGAGFRREAIDLIPGFATGPARLLVRRGLAWGARQWTRLGGQPTLGSLGPARLLLERARRRAADLTIVHNEVPHWVGRQLLKEGFRVAADIEDWHSEDLLPEQRRHRPLETLREIERDLLRHAAYTTTTSEALAEALHVRYGGVRPAVIANAFPLQPDPHRGPPGEPPAWFWFSQTLGPGRGLEAFVAAWALTVQPSRVVLLGEPVEGFVQALTARVPAERRAALTFLSPVPPAQLPSVIARHDVGLALEDATIVNRDLTITNKILQYLNAGLAVVATGTAGQREVLARAPAAGLILDLRDPVAAAAGLDGLLADRAQLARRQAAARHAAETIYSWERESAHLLRLVATALARPPAVPGAFPP